MKQLFLVRMDSSGAVKIFSVDGREINPSGRVSQRKPKAWAYTPKLGYESGSAPSNLCNPGWAATGFTVEQAMDALESVRNL